VGHMAMTRAIQLRTEIPGPRSREIIERKERVVADPLGLYLPIVVADGRGATVTDADGNSFVDFAGGVGCLNVGHAHPRVVAAVQEQAARFFHTDFTIVPYEIYVEYAERLTALAPFSGPVKAGFFNAGAEAVENAVKFARGYTRRPAVIGFEGAFHGRSLLALTLTSKTHPYKAGLGPFAPEVYRVPFPDEYRGITARVALDALERSLSTQVAAETVAAIVVEPVQGEGGFVPAPQEFMEGLRAICDREGILLVVDEVQTGFGRTGRMFAIEHYGIEPDLITVAKSIAGGLPLSGVLGKAEIMDGLWDGAVGGTYVGNPVALAAAVAVLDVFEEEGLVERAQRIGETIRARMLACSPGRSASTRSETCAGSARCSRSNTSRTAGRRSPRPASPRGSPRRRPSAGCCSSRPASTRIATASSARSSSRMPSSKKDSGPGRRRWKPSSGSQACRSRVRQACQDRGRIPLPWRVPRSPAT
jgi:4-aminobutyrate aminotransferase / (S)-3-amino-2-methylpropionate transaminase / 5-aminovalerate transaminase